MSKSWLKGLKKTKLSAAQPRQAQEIAQEYTDLCSKLGHAKYQVKFNQEVIESILGRLSELDREAGARKQADDAAVPKKEETPPAQATEGAQ